VFFSALVHVKMEARNQRMVEHDKRLALLSTQPWISSHWTCLWNSIAVWN